MIALLILTFTLCVSMADELDRLVDFALRNNPKIGSFENIKRSLDLKSKFSLALPNPRVDLAFNNFDTDGFFPRKENPMGSYALFVSQKYILPVKREKTSHIFLQRKEEIDARKEIYVKTLIRDLKLLYWDFSYSFEMEKILKDIEREIEFLIDITEEKYRFGDALISDLILLKVELLKVREKLVKAREIRETSLKKIYALAGGEIELEGSPLRKPEFLKEFDEERNVHVKLLKKELKTIKSEIDRLKVEHYPDIFLSGGYMIRPELANMFTFRVGITVPVWKKKKEDLLVLEKREIYRAKTLDLKNTVLKVKGDFEALKSSYLLNSETLEVVEKEIREKEYEIQALLIAYRYERTDIREILRAYRILWSLRFERARLLKTLNQLVAKAEALQ